ncbi:ABC transporter ATP-binding protein [Aminiphilus circumscriptus]|uniref:ABC transporter ATP-binding protein n=1 Tax=Aminiphilus circumscriptus TaxID=290732 RepID=UPI003B84B4FB
MMKNILVQTKGLKVTFSAEAGMFGGKARVVKAVDDVSIDIAERETYALVGESGCGKTTLGRAILRLVPTTGGQVFFRGEDLSSLSPEAMRSLRRKMQIIFQDPYASLNPRMRVREILAEPFRTHEPKMSAKDVDERIAALLSVVGMRSDTMRKYPHQFSGGQRQRIGIARALALHPEFIVCDEAVSALDVSIQAQVLNLLSDLQEEFRLTYLFITHNLSVVRHIADKVCVMFLGKAMEIGDTEDLFARPFHPYTKFLIAAAPVPDPTQRDRERLLLKGDIPSPINLPPGCRFSTRCPYAQERCRLEEPETAVLEGRAVSCHYPLV